MLEKTAVVPHSPDPLSDMPPALQAKASLASSEGIVNEADALSTTLPQGEDQETDDEDLDVSAGAPTSRDGATAGAPLSSTPSIRNSPGLPGTAIGTTDAGDHEPAALGIIPDSDIVDPEQAYLTSEAATEREVSRKTAARSLEHRQTEDHIVRDVSDEEKTIGHEVVTPTPATKSVHRKLTPVTRYERKRKSSLSEDTEVPNWIEDQAVPSKKIRLRKAATPDEKSEDGAEIQIAGKTSTTSLTPQPSRAGTATSGDNATSLMTRLPKVLLSGRIGKKSSPALTWLKKKKVDIVEEVPGRKANFVCVVKEKELPTTLKVLRSLMANKLVVTEQWLIDSRVANTVQKPELYIHAKVQGLIQRNRRSIFSGLTVFFTTAAAKAYRDWPAVQQMTKDVGAFAVESGSAQKGHDLTPKHRVVFFGEDPQGDVAAQELIRNHGRVVYGKSMLAQSILRAELDLDAEEFRLKDK